MHGGKPERVAKFGLGDWKLELEIFGQTYDVHAREQLADKVSDSVLGATLTEVRDPFAQDRLVDQRRQPHGAADAGTPHKVYHLLTRQPHHLDRRHCRDRMVHTLEDEDVHVAEITRDQKRHDLAPTVGERGKGGQYRNALLSADLLNLLRQWWTLGRQQGVMHRDGWLFPGQHALKPISTRQLHRIVAEAAHAADIAKRVGPHTLRHSFATHLLEDGVDIRIIQALLGHAKLDNTAFYTRVATRTVRAVTSPLDKLGMLRIGEHAPGG